MKKFRLSYSGSVTFEIDQLWPDGDAPPDPTAEDVIDLIDQCGGPEGILREWNMEDVLTLDVDEVGPVPARR